MSSPYAWPVDPTLRAESSTSIRRPNPGRARSRPRPGGRRRWDSRNQGPPGYRGIGELGSLGRLVQLGTPTSAVRRTTTASRVATPVAAVPNVDRDLAVVLADLLPDLAHAVAPSSSKILRGAAAPRGSRRRTPTRLVAHVRAGRPARASSGGSSTVGSPRPELAGSCRTRRPARRRSPEQVDDPTRAGSDSALKTAAVASASWSDIAVCPQRGTARPPARRRAASAPHRWASRVEIDVHRCTLLEISMNVMSWFCERRPPATMRACRTS